MEELYRGTDGGGSSSFQMRQIVHIVGDLGDNDPLSIAYTAHQVLD
jgi:hypothetical protein